MASPVGHALAGLAVGHGGGRDRRAVLPGEDLDAPMGRLPAWLLPGIAALAAIAPDLDFIPGLLVGDPNRFHQLHSHTAVAALSAGVVAGLLAWPSRLPAVRTALVVALAYASHLLLDLLTFDPREPIGIPVLWPFVEQHLASPWSLFRGIRHGVPGQGLGEVLAQIFSLHNLLAVGIEVAATLPILVLAHFVRQRSEGRRGG